MKFNRPGLRHIIAIILGMQFMAICFMPFFGLLPKSTARYIFSAQYFTTGLLLIVYTLHTLRKKGDDK